LRRPFCLAVAAPVHLHKSDRSVRPFCPRASTESAFEKLKGWVLNPAARLRLYLQAIWHEAVTSQDGRSRPGCPRDTPTPISGRLFNIFTCLVLIAIAC